MKINNINIGYNPYKVYPISSIGQSQNDLKKRDSNGKSEENSKSKFKDVLELSEQAQKKYEESKKR